MVGRHEGDGRRGVVGDEVDEPVVLEGDDEAEMPGPEVAAGVLLFGDDDGITVLEAHGRLLFGWSMRASLDGCC